jgi:hypothetical protein
VTDFIVNGGLGNLETKICRAYKHLQEFDSLVVKFCRSNPFTITEEDDLVHERHIRRCEFDPIEADIYLCLADVVYNLRSGLDQLAWQLALLGNPNPSREVMFPSHPDRSPRAEERLRRLVSDMPDAAVAIIKDLQPYNRANSYRDDPLWKLNELSNIDKHRRPTGRAMDLQLFVAPRGYLRRELDHGVEVSWALAAKTSVVFKPGIPDLVFGDPLDSSGLAPLELSRIEIAGIYNFVRESVAPRFARFFPACPDSEVEPRGS